MAFRVIPIALIAAGVACLWVGSQRYNHVQQLQEQYVFADAYILNFEIRMSRINNNMVKRYYHPILRVPMDDGGQEVVILGKGSEVKPRDDSNMLSIYYPKDDLNRAKIVGFMETQQPAYLAFLAALSLWGGAVISWRRLRPETGKSKTSAA